MARPAGIKGEQTRQRILASSLALFARSGYAAVSMREIALDVGVGAGALYNHFTTKQHILMAIMEDHMRALLSAYYASANACQRDAQTQLEAFVRFHISYHTALPNEVFLSYMELRALEPENFKIIEALRRNYETILKDILTLGVQQRQMACDDIHVSAMAILAMLTGVTSWFRQQGRLTRHQIENIYVSLVMRSVAVPMASQNQDQNNNQSRKIMPIKGKQAHV
ncbi:MAG: TetR/AcrR family transcriptional regulator [Alphaproteobacteria bacterium]|nr:TetR/AcrR family transcriptional regulator [Alphaproteobacteria bacterium]